MLQHFNAQNSVDQDQNPAGGWVVLPVYTPALLEGNRLNGGRAVVSGALPALRIAWQDGPLKDPATGETKEPNGAFVETVLAACAQRVEFYQTANNGKFACSENAEALEHIRLALEALERRTARRVWQGTEGTHQVIEGQG